MSFGAYLRWDGAIAVALGASLFAIGVVERHEGPADAVLGGVMMTAGSGLFLALRHRVPLRRPGAWFTHRPIAAAGSEPATARSGVLVAWLLGGQATAAALTVGLSVLTGFWLTVDRRGPTSARVGASRPTAATRARPAGRTRR